MRDPNPHITPSGRHSSLVAYPQVSESQDGADEVRRLLVQVVEVLGRPLDVRGEHLLHARLGQGRVHLHFVLGDGGQAFGVHPALHYEGPEVEGYLFWKEAVSLGGILFSEVMYGFLWLVRRRVGSMALWVVEGSVLSVSGDGWMIDNILQICQYGDSYNLPHA